MKSLIFCADGTWNGTDVDKDEDGELDTTNVLKLFHLLAGETTLESRRLKDEIEKELHEGTQLVQVAKYLHGVGDSGNPIKRLLGGTFGAGVIARIVRGYTFISRNYEPGDRIFVMGFSRGAYTARALAGMISSVGLLNKAQLDLSDKEQAYALGTSAWRQYRDNARKAQPEKSLREKLASMISDLPGFARIPLRDGDLLPAPVAGVAVWDTVGALGIPNAGAAGKAVDAYRFADDKLSSNVAVGLHAVSLHEQRDTFAPTLWQKRDNITQVWFAGAHADVGGGYPAHESGLSNLALQWMVEELTKLQVLFKPFPTDWSLDFAAEMHRPWAEGVFAKLPCGPRVWDGYHLVAHASLDQRRAQLGDELVQLAAISRRVSVELA
jgi:glutathione S-transferase